MENRQSTIYIFRNYFLTVQLITGLVMAAKMFVEGMSGYGTVWTGLLYAAGGFAIVIPFTALAAWIRTVIELRRQRRLAALPGCPECL
jgi:hypothetical protein